jgi:MSHA biogenesis protein MshL
MQLLARVRIWAHIYSLGLGLVFSLQLAGCANKTSGPNRIDAEINNMAGREAAAIPLEVDNAMTANQLDAPVKERRFDVSVNNMGAKTFFNALGADAGVNVVTDPDVNGAISLQLRQVTLDEVMNIVRDMYGYEYNKQGNIYSVYARQARTQVFQINNIDVLRNGQTDTQVNIGSNSGTAGNASGQTNATSDQAQLR